MSTRLPTVAVIGAGIGGLVCAAELADAGYHVDVFERADAPGGKMRQVVIDDARLDAGPTVLTMRWVFDGLYRDLGECFDDALDTEPLEILARHAWSATERLDLFADIDRSAQAIAAFSSPKEAEGFRRFSRRAREVYDTLERNFIRSASPSPGALVRHGGIRGLRGLLNSRPFDTLWTVIGEYFHDPRLRQLFARYATYCGSSPYAATATLVLIAHVEQAGVWRVSGGMHALARSLEQLAIARGATFHYNCAIERVQCRGGAVRAIEPSRGDSRAVDAIIVNADTDALAQGSFGPEVGRALKPRGVAERSLSAITWNLLAKTSGFPLSHHNVFFNTDYRAEFETIFNKKQLPEQPTVYVCAQDRLGGQSTDRDLERERLLCLVNAPASADHHPLERATIDRCEAAAFALLERCGLRIERSEATTRRTTPSDFDRLFPATGGALYGSASHGWKSAFSRPVASTSVRGLFLAGGSVHPGAGVPMAALSGRFASDAARYYLSARRGLWPRRGLQR